MSPTSLAIFILGVGLEAALIARALVTGATQRFPLLYSYLAYVLCCEFIAVFTLYFYPQHYPNVFWFNMVGRTLTEFAVIMGVSDSIFRPYPAIRNLGRLIVVASCVAFIALSWGPVLSNPQPTPIAILDLQRNSALTKGFAIATILASAQVYRIRLGRNAGGILLGLAALEAIAATNYAAAGQFGPTVYAGVLRWLTPMSYGVCWTIWTFALWNPDAALHRRVEAAAVPGLASGRPEFQLRRFSTFVTRLLWK